MQRHTPIEIEHRLTVCEVTQVTHANRITEHAQRLSEIDSSIKSISDKQITPRDWMMIAAGVMAVLGALLGKIDWQQALAVLARN
jgi:hypothetical protein